MKSAHLETRSVVSAWRRRPLNARPRQRRRAALGLDVRARESIKSYPRGHPRGHLRDHPIGHPIGHPRDHPRDHPIGHPIDKQSGQTQERAKIRLRGLRAYEIEHKSKLKRSRESDLKIKNRHKNRHKSRHKRDLKSAASDVDRSHPLMESG